MNFTKLFLLNGFTTFRNHVRGLKNYKPPPTFDHIELPERTKLRYIDKVPQYPGGIRAPRMQKKLRLMRGPELVHNTLIHKQYGIMVRFSAVSLIACVYCDV